MFEQFTDSARQVVVYAQEDARQFQHDYIGTEHVLLGLLHDDDQTSHALQAVGLDSASVGRALERAVGRGARPPSAHIPFTPRAKRALEEALRVAQRLGQAHIGRPHLLRGLLEVRDGTAVRLLADLGVDVDALRVSADGLAAGNVGVVSHSQVHVAMASVRGGTVARARRMSDTEIATQIGALAQDVATHADQLLAALRRYGRHEEGCDPDAGCTCGLDAALGGTETS
jgi:ATP-dependent Clp protease ATP-binding subunit ClpC